MTPDEEIRRGNRARNILGDEIYTEAYQAIRDRIWTQLAQAECPADRRERLNSLAIALDTVKRYMEQVMQSGKMAAEQIERDRTFTERMRDKIRSVA